MPLVIKPEKDFFLSSLSPASSHPCLPSLSSPPISSAPFYPLRQPYPFGPAAAAAPTPGRGADNLGLELLRVTHREYLGGLPA